MALKRKNEVDETLAIVRDVDKFKKRILELGEAKKALGTATKKHAEKNKALVVELNVKVAEANTQLAAAIARAKELDSQGSAALAEARRVEGDTNKREKSMARRDARLEQDRAILRRDKEALVEERKAFDSLVSRFKSAATAACNGVG